MRYTFYETAILFFAWSFLAWLAETAVATIKEKDFRNRGFASGPFCFIYGFTGVLLPENCWNGWTGRSGGIIPVRNGILTGTSVCSIPCCGGFWEYCLSGTETDGS